MPATRITRLAATAIMAAASITGAIAMAGPAHASIVGKDDGYGATLQAAERNALGDLHADYYGCQAPAYYYDYGQGGGGQAWYAWVEETCQGYN